jgi:peptide chain release factor subunit 3
MTEPKQTKPSSKLNPFASEFIPGQFTAPLFASQPTHFQTAAQTLTPQPQLHLQSPQQPQSQPQPQLQLQSHPTTFTKETWEENIEEDSQQRPKTPPAMQQKDSVALKHTLEKVTDNTLSDPADKTLHGEIVPATSETEELEKLRLEEPFEDNDTAVDDFDPREPINLVFIGHVDAGKSTICGNILFQTGKVDQRTIQKYEAEAKQNNRSTWFYAYIMDTNEEERAKGKTVEVGRAQFETEKKRYTILDAPGHKNYVPNMLMGVAQADIAVLVVSAKKGEFESGFDKNGQTREHAILAKTLGIKKLVVAVNKMDEPTVGWSQARYDEIVSKLTAFLKQYNYNMKDVVFVPVSGFSGVNIKERVSSTICPWYTGESLLDTLDAFEPIERNEKAPLRVPILDKVRDMGVLFLMGKVESGVIHKKDMAMLMPGKTTVEVVTIANDLRALNFAKPGENVRIGVKGVDEEHVHRGFVLCSAESPVHVVTEFVAQVVLLDLPPHKSVFCAGYQCVIHIHTAVEEVIVVRVLADLDKKTGQVATKLPKFVLSRSFCVVHFQTNNSKELCMETFASIQQLGRFTLRDEGKTIAFGKVLSLGPPKKKSKK